MPFGDVLELGVWVRAPKHSSASTTLEIESPETSWSWGSRSAVEASSDQPPEEGFLSTQTP